MDIKEVINLKEKLEMEIVDFINEKLDYFTEAAGVTPTAFDVAVMTMQEMGRKDKLVVAGVEIEVVL